MTDYVKVGDNLEDSYELDSVQFEVDGTTLKIKGLIYVSEEVNLQNGDAKTTVYTVPTGKTMIPIFVVIRSPSGSLADGVDFDIGSGANADTWKQTNDLSAMTATTDYKVITDSTKYTMEVAGSEFGIKPITGATADVTATMDLFGYLF